jgi:hypothetical protein
VMYSHHFPHTFQLTSVQDAVPLLRATLRATGPNTAGAAYVREQFSWQGEIARLVAIYRGLLDCREVADQGRTPTAC